MFTQIFQAVENLSTQPHSPSTDDQARESLSRSNSIDSQLRPSSPLSSGQLAESALVSLRKSLAAQRSSSPSPKNAGVRDHRSPKSTLEDRLRAAAFAIGEASNPSSTGASARVSPAPPSSASQRSLSPCSTPLPESPKASLEMEAAVPLAPPAASPVTTTSVQLPPSSPRRLMSTDTSAPTSESPRPLLVDESSATTDSARDLPEAAPVVPNSHSGSTDVEVLQERLKQVELRFTSMCRSPNVDYPNFFLHQMYQRLSRSCRPRKLLLTWLSGS
jgi:hypothetical protein